MKKIEVGNGTFAKLIESDNIYVDKTDIIYNLITSGSTFFFCSRPRRFGKTLTLSTLEEIFKGNKELFKGLKIYDTDYDWKAYPIIHIDLGNVQGSNAEQLMIALKDEMRIISSQYGIKLESELPSSMLRELISKISEESKVVILIDEYDKILSSNIYNPNVEEMREVLRGFFEIIKAASAHIHFAFITGVTKFSKVSIFSSMNNLNDITLDEPYATLFGYTEEEVKHYFSEYIEEGIKKTGLSYDEYMAKLEKKYNGNRFSPDSDITVYNPVSVGLFFSKGGKNFNNYWIDTGGMKLLMDVAKHIDFDISKDITTPISKSDITVFDILEMASNTVSPYQYKSLLFQSGYLTIKSMNQSGDIFVLDFPNDEVAEAYSENILASYMGNKTGSLFKSSDLRKSFDNGNTEEAIDKLKAVYASIPYDLLKKADEAHYSTAFFCMMKALGANIGSELETSKGRIDAVLENKRHIYIFEFKYNKTADIALSQIHETKYYEPYIAGKKKVHLIGMNFSSKEKNINEWKEEIL